MVRRIKDSPDASMSPVSQSGVLSLLHTNIEHIQTKDVLVRAEFLAKALLHRADEAMESAERQARLEKLRREAEAEMRRNLDDSGPPRKRSKRQGETRSATLRHG